MLYKIIIILLLLTGSINSNAENFKYPLVYEMYKTVYVTQVNKEARQVETKVNLTSKPKVYTYNGTNNSTLFNNNLKNIKLNKQYQILVRYKPDYDKSGNSLQNAKEKYDTDEGGTLVAVCKGQCNI